jgi:polyhydroxybutyrate depolymerase
MINQKLKVLFVFLALFALPGSLSAGNSSGTTYPGSIIVGGLKRTYLLHVPPARDKIKPRPLLIALHGGGGQGKHMRRLTRGGFDRLSDQEGFVVVYPDGIEKHWNDGRNRGATGYRAHQDDIDDVGFIAALIDRLVKEQDIDPRRVYVTGMSNGAMMSYRLAGDLSEKITAVAPVAGNIPGNLYPSCSPSRPVPVLAINNVNDPLMPFAGGNVTGPWGRKKLGDVLSTAETVAFWAKHNDCSLSPVVTYEPDRDPQDGTRARKETYWKGINDATVILYAIEGGGHTWPGGYQYFNERIIGKTSRDMDASEVIWGFFKKHKAP